MTCFVTTTILSLQGYSRLGRLNAVRQYYGPRALEMWPGKARQVEHASRSGRIKDFQFTMLRKEAAEAMMSLGGTAEPHPSGGEAWIVTVPGSVLIEELDALCDRVRDDVPPHPEAEKIAQMRAAAANTAPDDPEKDRVEAGLALLEGAHKSEMTPFLHASATIDLSPFTLETFEESAAGYRSLRARILDLGFVLTEDENHAWDRRIAALRNREEELA